MTNLVHDHMLKAAATSNTCHYPPVSNAQLPLASAALREPISRSLLIPAQLSIQTGKPRFGNYHQRNRQPVIVEDTTPINNGPERKISVHK